MQTTAGFEINKIPEASFSDVKRTVDSYFASVEFKPDYFDYWIKSLRADEKHHTIGVMSDVHADLYDYYDLLRNLVYTVAKKHSNLALSGNYTLDDDDDVGMTFFYFTMKNGKVDWEVTDEDGNPTDDEFGDDEYDDEDFDDD